jgi:hypothetical protein
MLKVRDASRKAGWLKQAVGSVFVREHAGVNKIQSNMGWNILTQDSTVGDGPEARSRYYSFGSVVLR